jgi:DNA segregation ATPase FtsK/SpoIIIE-like protein
MKNSTLWTIFGMLLTLLALFYTYLYLRPILDTALTLVIVAVVVAIAAGAGAVIVIAVNQSEASREKRLTLRAERQVVEADARMRNAEAERVAAQSKIISTVTKPGEILHLTYLDQAHETSTTVLPTLAGSTHVNGRYIEPSAAEQRNWLTHQALYAPKGGSDLAPVHPLLEAGVSQPLPQTYRLSDYVNQPSINSLFLGVGKYPDGQVRPVNAPLNKLTHIAIGGSSGFGKSVQLQSLAYQILNASEQTRVVLMDAQGTTFSLYEDHPNLMYPVAVKEKEILLVLKELLGELDRRDRLMNQWRGITNLSDYNRVADEPLPVLPIMFDEFGLLADHKEGERAVKKLAISGRKVGMHCTFATQVWNTSEVSSVIRANLATTIQYYARDKSQSRVLLGDSIAAEITRPGEAYAILPGTTGLIHLQAPLLDGKSQPTRRERSVSVADVIDIEPEAETLAVEDEKFLKLVEAGVSPSDACFRAYGKPYAGAQFYHCKDLLEQEKQQ